MAQKGAIETASGHFISRKAILGGGGDHVLFKGKCIIEDCIIRGDMAGKNKFALSAGKYCRIANNCVLRPVTRIAAGQVKIIPMTIGDFVHIEEGSIVEASEIGSCVRIGKNCVIGKNVIIKDCCEILDNSVIAANTVVPPFSVFGGVPGVWVDELPECAKEYFESRAKSYYDDYVASQEKRDRFEILISIQYGSRAGLLTQL